MKNSIVLFVVSFCIFSCASKTEKTENQKNEFVPAAELQKEIDQRKLCIEEFIASEFGQLVMNSESDPTLNQIANLPRVPKTCTTDQAIRVTRLWSKIYRQESMGAYLFSSQGSLAKDLKFVREYLETHDMSVGENLIHLIGLNRIAKSIVDTKGTKKYNKSIDAVAKEFKLLAESLEQKWIDIFARTTAHESKIIQTEIVITSIEELLGSAEQQAKLPAEEMVKIKSLNKEAEVAMFTNWQKSVQENKKCLEVDLCRPCVATITNEVCTNEKKLLEEESLKKFLFAELILPKYADGFEKIKISTQRLSAIVKKF